MVMDGLDGPLDVKVHWSTIIFNEPITAKRVEKSRMFFCEGRNCVSRSDVYSSPIKTRDWNLNHL